MKGNGVLGALLKKILSCLCLEEVDVFCCCLDKYLRKNVTCARNCSSALFVNRDLRLVQAF
jgi:hypothetical protein